jgi:two-component system response regulator YesN
MTKGNSSVSSGERVLNDFCRLFKKCFNQTFKEYLNAFRVQKAKAFIDLGSSATLAAVSSKFGFTNQNHFSRMFKKHIGVLPSEYMNQKKEIK